MSRSRIAASVGVHPCTVSVVPSSDSDGCVWWLAGVWETERSGEGGVGAESMEYRRNTEGVSRGPVVSGKVS